MTRYLTAFSLPILFCILNTACRVQHTQATNSSVSSAPLGQPFDPMASSTTETVTPTNTTPKPSQQRVQPVVESNPEVYPRPSQDIEPNTYVVARGDTLRSIARTQLGTDKAWAQLASLNQLQPPYTLKVGQKIKLPSAKPTKPTPPPTGTRHYTVKRGDTLSSIAKRELGNTAKWKDIAKLNKLSSPYTLKLGQVIILPLR